MEALKVGVQTLFVLLNDTLSLLQMIGGDQAFKNKVTHMQGLVNSYVNSNSDLMAAATAKLSRPGSSYRM
jgi:hypothetical protein